jgi:hypothetical protein
MVTIERFLKGLANPVRIGRDGTGDCLHRGQSDLHWKIFVQIAASLSGESHHVKIR